MKLTCPCGATLRDQSDFLGFKAHVIADHDYFDLLDALLLAARSGQTEQDVHAAFHRYAAATAYQCSSCHRLLVDRGREVAIFAPEQAGDRALLQSVDEEDWRRNLRGRWSNGRGELWWGFTASPAGDNGFVSDIASWEELQRRYHEVLDRLREAGRLRDAFLARDGATVHAWPGADVQTEKPGNR